MRTFSKLSKKSEAIMVAHLEGEIKHYSRTSVKDGDNSWDSFVDGKLTALEQVLQFVQQNGRVK